MFSLFSWSSTADLTTGKPATEQQRRSSSACTRVTVMVAARPLVHGEAAPAAPILLQTDRLFLGSHQFSRLQPARPRSPPLATIVLSRHVYRDPLIRTLGSAGLEIFRNPTNVFFTPALRSAHVSRQC